MARRRPLRPEEQELWQAVARTARAMHATAPPPPRVVVVDPPLAPQMPAVVTPRLGAFRLGERGAGAKPPPLTAPLADPPVQMDARAFHKMTRGKLVPDARIDLHGMTLAEAHPELIRFMLNAQSAGARLVLVITGKGKRGPDHGPIPQRQGVLRHQVPQWLRLPPLGPVVLQVAEAHLRHGGAGAFYVYLRRTR